MIPMEHLTCFGEVYWVSEERAIKLWVDGLQIRSAMQYVTPYVAPVYNEVTYDYKGNGISIRLFFGFA